MTAPLAEQVAAAMSAHGYAGTYRYVGGKLIQDCTCGAEILGQRHREHEADAVLRVVAEWLGSEAAVETTARVMASMEPGEDWPTNLALGGNLTGTRDDEYRDGMREEAAGVLKALRDATRPPDAPNGPAPVSPLDPRGLRGAQGGAEGRGERGGL